jgi:hypothetical protein
MRLSDVNWKAALGGDGQSALHRAQIIRAAIACGAYVNRVDALAARR